MFYILNILKFKKKTQCDKNEFKHCNIDYLKGNR